ncbi:MAG: Cardiolipin synthase [Chlamydiae bacterium]|nr:Cardiolipin synthase [Chlamydiota bacterium]
MSVLPVTETSIRPEFPEQQGIGRYKAGAHWKDLPLIEKIRTIFIAAMKIWIASIAIALIAGSIASLALLPHLALLVAAVAGMSAAILGTCLAASSIRDLYKVGDDNPTTPCSEETPKLGKWSQNRVYMTENSADSVQMKLKLVEMAEHSIEISGSFCGGVIFDEMLTLIEKKLEANPKLTVKIIFCDDLVTSTNRKHIARLGKKYPNQFYTLITKIQLHYFPTFRPEGNHTKMVVVDGTICMTGGTGIQDMLSREGTEKGLSPNLTERFLGIGTRDMDAMIEGPLALTMRQQFYQLLAKWNKKTSSGEKYGTDAPVNLVKKPIARAVPFFDQLGITGSPADATLLASGFEHGSECEIKLAYLQMIRAAQKTIYIANLNLNYPEIQEAVEEAARRGIQVTIITNGDNSTTPFLTKILGVVNRSNMYGLSQYGVKCHEFSRDNILYHKKVMVVDGQLTTIGSFNISHDCVICYDEEVAIIDSVEIASKTISSLQQDIWMSTPLLKSEYDGIWGTVRFAVNEFRAAVLMQATGYFFQ